MAATATERMLAAATDRTVVRAGETIEVDVDVSWVHETQTDIFREKFEELGGEVWDREKVLFLVDHFPNPTNRDQAERLSELQAYAEEKQVPFRKVGIKHQAWRMLGIARPGAIMVGPDSHTPTAGALGAFAMSVGPTDTAIVWSSGQTWLEVPETVRFDIDGDLPPGVTPRDVGFRILERHGGDTEYFAENSTVEFGGETVRHMGLDGRQTLCNMGTEMGATSSFVEPDERLRTEYLDPKVDEPYEVFASDDDAEFRERHELAVDELVPKVAYPHSPGNVHDVDEAEGIEIDQFFLGSCANGHLDDLAIAADILEGHDIAPDTELIVTPATDEIRKQASAEGILDTFIQAGARVTSNYCSVCLGYEGVLDAGERCLSTNTRNYRGRMGHPDSEIYLGSPATLAASAVKGTITDPRTVVTDR